jgi:hypothetical protein
MKFELSSIALILAVIGFYIKLLTSHRRKVVEWEKAQGSPKKVKAKMGIAKTKPVLGTFSRNKRDWAIGAAGYLLMMLGILIYVGWLPLPTLKPTWWYPVMVGIVLFGWFFN